MAGGRLADGEGVGAVGGGGDGAEVVPSAGGIVAEEDDLSAGEGGAVGGEGAGEGEGLIDGGVRLGGGEGEGGRRGRADGYPHRRLREGVILISIEHDIVHITPLSTLIPIKEIVAVLIGKSGSRLCVLSSYGSIQIYFLSCEGRAVSVGEVPTQCEGLSDSRVSDAAVQGNVRRFEGADDYPGPVRRGSVVAISVEPKLIPVLARGLLAMCNVKVAVRVGSHLSYRLPYVAPAGKPFLQSDCSP